MLKPIFWAPRLFIHPSIYPSSVTTLFRVHLRNTSHGRCVKKVKRKFEIPYECRKNNKSSNPSSGTEAAEVSPNS